jgi:hypothetical protein
MAHDETSDSGRDESASDDLPRTAEDHEYLACRRSRREFLAELRTLGFGGMAGLFLGASAVRASAELFMSFVANSPYPAEPGGREPGVEEDPCLLFHEYSDGGWCTPSYSCGGPGMEWSFHCTGGWDDDYECTSFTLHAAVYVWFWLRCRGLRARICV